MTNTTKAPGETKVGFIGTGVMGKSMAGHIQQAGYPLHVYTRTAAKAEALVKEGAVWHDTPGKLAAECDVIITMVGYPKDVEEIYLGEDGLVANAKPGSYLIDMTTSSPLLAARIYEAAEAKGLHALDAPVSGGDIGARDAKLSIMVGGSTEAFEAVRPLFEQMGTNIVLQGKSGAGQHTKMCNQIAIASGMMGVCEALAYAKTSGLDAENVLKSIATGAAGSWSLSNLGPRMIAGDYEPGFYVKHFIKDMGIALESAKAMGMKTPGLALAESLYQEISSNGLDEKGTQVLYTYYLQA
ncbi:NAD(P)-dependent oxidoreductase [Paenibacillus taichungensis]|uniref:NAD(P)-dependent oxidoreductase n=1 Tax=Paenibacillus taichungensis TaxID=484184 RepID=A0ABX2MVX7_9BACL|nr:NAD(P)-dependent oxidoreductase [Paenibacillus taichungensis]MDR9743848.1 NAD(P)-dependent oxidoreductase [Paenibacillus taichungensis]MEC0106374.1 NAD(P)-dependent oxidoreductase [Paenibacillus taichungensis]MEC0197068.1 NAD(P)-dependent oxidoreductase [Paenibacillus taichungensis]NUU57977.1 NAD(P)-dependent oxidoreductase [Paenibacillus taichungensis]